MSNVFDLQDAVGWLAARTPSSGRALLALAGPPGVGKSTIADRLVNRLNGYEGLQAVVAPMDGFHMSSEKLKQRGLLTVKGRIDTFELGELFEHVTQLKQGRSVVWPTYDRVRHEPDWSGPPLHHEVNWVIFEGNYLLCRPNVAPDLPELFDLRWAIDDADNRLRERLLIRHQATGRSAVDANNRIERVDLPNALVVRKSFHEADQIWLAPTKSDLFS